MPGGVTAAANATVMRGRIAEYTDDASGETFRGIEPLLTPRVTTEQRLEWDGVRWLSLSVEGRYTGRSQLDNTGNPNLVLPPAHVIDGALVWRFGGERRQAIELRANNLTNSNRYGSGYGGDRPYYYVLPPRNVFATLKLDF